ncbi:hypothetical protein E5288_WYG017823 [Bos mutus]|uniref:Cadherin domain-containing protein n=1 Tax=Bos mutus TaxID=72004 RepID=A0A6B0S3U0_9CETA|nr:hypothetical protein [Bos mutus]
MIAKDTVVAKLQCHDLDEPPDTIHYAPSLRLIGSGKLFEQVPTAGNFIQNDLLLKICTLNKKSIIFSEIMLYCKVVKELDYEDPDIVSAGHIYEMTISVFDDLHPFRTVTVTIVAETAPANDFSPVFKAVHYSFSIPETSGAFYKVVRVTAIDEDHPPNCVTYKISSADIQVIQRFWIYTLSGMTELTTQPGYKTVKQYNLTDTSLWKVVADILDKNDEAPVWTPSVYQAVIFDNVVAGTNVNGFQLNCHDRDSQDFEMRFEMVSGNVNNHFGFDPTRGSNTLKLTVKNPFNFESGAKLQRQEIKHMAGDRNQKEMVVTGNRNKKLEVLTETIVYETVFDGEAVDPF